MQQNSKGVFSSPRRSINKRFTPVQIWFLDDNLVLSARYATNEILEKSISGCMQALICARFYFIGIRSKKFYDYFFGKQHIQDTMDRFFPNWPLNRKPSFSNYKSIASKWCRMCNENFQYILHYLRILLLEYSRRKGKTHILEKFVEWHDNDAPRLSIPAAHLKKIVIPWKCLHIKYRRKNIVEGYRLQFMHRFENDDPYQAYAESNVDIPEFVVKHFNLNISGIE